MNHQNFIDLPQIISAGGEITLPGSKSISNRILLLSALTKQKIIITNLLLSDDTNYMLNALQTLGVKIEKSENSDEFIIYGCGGNFTNKNAELFLGNAGTAFRSLTAMLALSDGNYTLKGVERMHQRPILDLLEPLQKLGATISELQNKGFPPLQILPFQFDENCNQINVNANISSQYLSALLMAIPSIKSQANQKIRLNIVGTLISSPYIAMTLNLLAKFNIAINTNFFHEKANIFFEIPLNQQFIYANQKEFFVESDASSASYFLAMGAITKNPEGVKVIGVGKNSIQGDIKFAEVLQRMGAKVSFGENFIHVQPPQNSQKLKPLCVDCLEFPDAAMTLAVLAMFCDYEKNQNKNKNQNAFILQNIDSWRVKETDRILAMQQELAKFDFIATWNENSHELAISKKTNSAKNSLKATKIDTYDDHRMAMCFSLAAFATPLRINEPTCVAKTYPNYFADFQKIVRFAPIIAIDGPSASGKGSVASAVAERLGFAYLDSGALYRITAFVANQQNIDLISENAQQIADLISKLSAENKIRFSTRNGEIFLENQNISKIIRSEQIGKMASKIATFPEVRNALLFVFRNFRKNPGLVADGRDMGSVVFADADCKIILTASAEIRAKRRFLQLQQQGFSVSDADYQTIFQDLCQRDKSDKERKIAPLKSSKEAVEINSDNLTLEEVINKVIEIYKK